MADPSRWFVTGVLLGIAVTIAAVAAAARAAVPRCPRCERRSGVNRVPNRDAAGYHCRHCDRFFVKR